MPSPAPRTSISISERRRPSTGADSDLDAGLYFLSGDRPTSPRTCPWAPTAGGLSVAARSARGVGRSLVPFVNTQRSHAHAYMRMRVLQMWCNPPLGRLDCVIMHLRCAWKQGCGRIIVDASGIGAKAATVAKQITVIGSPRLAVADCALPLFGLCGWDPRPARSTSR